MFYNDVRDNDIVQCDIRQRHPSAASLSIVAHQLQGVL